jgi:hypothetical protein
MNVLSPTPLLFQLIGLLFVCGVATAKEETDVLSGVWMTYGSQALGPVAGIYMFEGDKTYKCIESFLPGICMPEQAREVPNGSGLAVSGAYTFDGKKLVLRKKGKAPKEQRFKVRFFEAGERKFMALTPEGSEQGAVYFRLIIEN